MGATNFSGPLNVGLPPEPVGRVTEVIEVPLAVTAVANTDVAQALPAGCRILRVQSKTTTAFTGTTVTAQLGTTVGGAELSAALDVKPLASARSHVLLDTAAAVAAISLWPGGNLNARLVQTGPTAVGAGVLLIEYARTGN